MGEVRIKRVYEPALDSDGYRVLVDRVWPRGISTDRAALDEWAKDLAPSVELRKWFGHDSSRFKKFRERYRAELADQQALLQELCSRARREPVTILYSARDERHNNAVVLEELLSDR